MDSGEKQLNEHDDATDLAVDQKDSSTEQDVASPGERKTTDQEPNEPDNLDGDKVTEEKGTGGAKVAIGEADPSRPPMLRMRTRQGGAAGGDSPVRARPPPLDANEDTANPTVLPTPSSSGDTTSVTATTTTSSNSSIPITKGFSSVQSTAITTDNSTYSTSFTSSTSTTTTSSTSPPPSAPTSTVPTDHASIPVTMADFNTMMRQFNKSLSAMHGNIEASMVGLAERINEIEGAKGKEEEKERNAYRSSGGYREVQTQPVERSSPSENWTRPDRITDQISELIHRTGMAEERERFAHRLDNAQDRMIDDNYRDHHKSNINLLPRRPAGPESVLNPTATAFSPRHQPSRPNRSTVQESLSRSSLGYPIMDDNQPNHPTRSRQRFAVDEDGDNSGYFRRTARQFEHLTYGNDRITETLRDPNNVLSTNRDKNDTLKRFNPLQGLQYCLKERKVLTKTEATYVPWKDYMERVFRSCYLECLVFMDPRWATDWERKDWEDLDQRVNCIDAREFTYNAFAVYGSIPTPSSEDSFEVLNGIFLGVMKAFPQLIPALMTVIDDSLDKTALSHIKSRVTSDTVTIRMMYFRGRLLFMDPLSDARMRALRDFSQDTKYDTSMSPMEFLQKATLKAEIVDELYDTRQVSDAWLWSIVVDGITSVTGDFYDSIRDVYRKDAGYIAQSRATMIDVVTLMDNKYKEKRRRSKPSMYGMFVTDETGSPYGTGAETETLNYVGSTNRSKQDHHHQTKGRGGGQHTSKLPCYAFQRNGKCAFGSKCKYSHDENVLAKAPPPPSIENMAALVDSFVELNAAVAAQKQDYKKRLKKMKKTLKNSKKKPVYPANQTLQSVLAQANAVVSEEKDDTIDSTVSLAEETSEEDSSTTANTDQSE